MSEQEILGAVSRWMSRSPGHDWLGFADWLDEQEARLNAGPRLAAVDGDAVTAPSVAEATAAIRRIVAERARPANGSLGGAR